jgi:hypothetical protein
MHSITIMACSLPVIVSKTIQLQGKNVLNIGCCSSLYNCYLVPISARMLTIMTHLLWFSSALLG